MTARIVFLGDTLLGSKAQGTLQREGYRYALDGLRPVLEPADLVVINHEGPVSAGAPAAPKTYGARHPSRRCAKPASLGALAEAGIGLASLGNNHILDHGEQGLADTLAHLDAAGIRHCGAGPDDVAARRGVDVEVCGERLHVVSAMEGIDKRLEVNYYADASSPGPALLEPAALATGSPRAAGCE